MKGYISNDIDTVFKILLNRYTSSGLAAASDLTAIVEQTVPRVDIGEGCAVATFSLVGRIFRKRPPGKFKKERISFGNNDLQSPFPGRIMGNISKCIWNCNPHLKRFHACTGSDLHESNGTNKGSFHVKLC